MGKLRSSLYKSARILGDIEAVGKGKAGKRIQRRAAGKITGRALRGSGCFIATACFDSPLAHEVRILLWFRDRYLLKNLIGQLFVKVYYSVSPFIAGLIQRWKFFSKLTALILKPVICLLKFCKSR